MNFLPTWCYSVVPTAEFRENIAQIKDFLEKNAKLMGSRQNTLIDEVNGTYLGFEY